MKILLQKFPFITLKQSLVLLRVSTAALFIAHAVIRITGGTTGRFGGFLNDKGLLIGVPIVWAITAYEIIAGSLLCIGVFTRWLSAGFIVLLITGIILIHAANGWFVGEHGTGGVEYSFALIVTLIVIAANAKPKY
ncbi:MAG: DoxX family protein [Sphingobacteriales bacterium]|nr:MAG: DoxX family protein [Sphingobacteriales bacterium]